MQRGEVMCEEHGFIQICMKHPDTLVDKKIVLYHD